MPIESRKPWRAEVQRIIPKWGTIEPVTWNEISFNIFDSTGRPISEDPKPNPAGVLFEYKKLPFLDCREGNLGNDTAYKSLSSDVKKSLGILAYLRSELPTSKNESEFDKLNRIVNAGRILPVWYVYKSDNPIRNGEVPTPIAGVTKIARGLHKPFVYIEYGIVQDRYKGVQSKPDISFLKSPQAFYNYANQENLLNSQQYSGVSCPASIPMLENSIAVLLEKPDAALQPFMAQAEESLRLTKDELRRIAQFADAVRLSTVESLVYHSYGVEVTEYERALLSSKGIYFPMQSPEHYGSVLRHKTKLLDVMNRTQNRSNNAFKRGRPNALTSADFPDPKFVTVN